MSVTGAPSGSPDVISDGTVFVMREISRWYVGTRKFEAFIFAVNNGGILIAKPADKDNWPVRGILAVTSASLRRNRRGISAGWQISKGRQIFAPLLVIGWDVHAKAVEQGWVLFL